MTFLPNKACPLYQPLSKHLSLNSLFYKDSKIAVSYPCIFADNLILQKNFKLRRKCFFASPPSMWYYQLKISFFLSFGSLILHLNYIEVQQRFGFFISFLLPC